MNATDREARDTVIEFAAILFGLSWRDTLAEKAGVNQRDLCHWLAEGTPLPSKVTLCALRLMQIHLDNQFDEQSVTDERIDELRSRIFPPGEAIPTHHVMNNCASNDDQPSECEVLHFTPRLRLVASQQESEG